MMTVSPALAAKQLAAVATALYHYNFINITSSPTALFNAVNFVVSSVQQMKVIANSTGLTLQDVNRTMSYMMTCLNNTEPLKIDTVCFGQKPQVIPNIINCEQFEYKQNSIVLITLVSIASTFIIIWSFVNKRKSCCLKCCAGRPGPLPPLNMLDSYENRFGCALAFGTTTSFCLIILFGSVKSILGPDWGKIIDATPGYTSIFFKMMAAVLVAETAYPIFVCMETKHKITGSVIGFFYCLTWFCLKCWKIASIVKKCASGDRGRVLRAYHVLAELPQFFCLFLLVIKFIYVFVVSMKKRKGRWNEKAEDIYLDFKEQYMYHHVKNLLKGIPIEKNPLEKQTLKMKLKQKVYKWKPEFKYSLRVVCAFIVSAIAVYTLAISLLGEFWYLVDYQIGQWVDSDIFLQSYLSNLKNKAQIIKDVRLHFRIWTACFYTAIAISSLKTFIIFLNMLAWYRGHIIRLRMGDRSWLPTSIKTLNSSPASLVAASMKFAGFQVAYVVWGFALFGLLLWVILGFLISFFFQPLFAGKSSFLLKLVGNLWPALLISLTVAFAQTLAAKFFFLQQRGAVISIDNRRAFSITSYHLFFFNIFLGLFSCLMRVIKSLIAGVLFLERLQKSLLPRSYELKDPGYYAYLGYILVEHSHANPVLCVFFSLLNEHAHLGRRADLASQLFVPNKTLSDRKETESLELSDQKRNDKTRWRIMRNKWNLAYTLINNPSLKMFRRSQEKVDDEEEFEDEKLVEEKEKRLEKEIDEPIIYTVPISV